MVIAAAHREMGSLVAARLGETARGHSLQEIHRLSPGQATPLLFARRDPYIEAEQKLRAGILDPVPVGHPGGTPTDAVAPRSPLTGIPAALGPLAGLERGPGRADTRKCPVSVCGSSDARVQRE